MAPEPQSPVRRQRALGGMLLRRECWTLSRTAKLLILALVIGGVLVVRFAAYPFLAVRSAVDADVLVVEGWIPLYTAEQAGAEFVRGGYRSAFVIRPVYESANGRDYGHYGGDYIATVLVKGGVPGESVETVYFSGTNKDRTYFSAVGFKQWLAERGESVESFNVATVGPHARRSWLQYRRAFGDSARVGIIALDDPQYDSARWWRSSAGVRETLGEAIAFFYDKFHFTKEGTGST